MSAILQNTRRLLQDYQLTCQPAQRANVDLQSRAVYQLLPDAHFSRTRDGSHDRNVSCAAEPLLDQLLVRETR